MCATGGDLNGHGAGFEQKATIRLREATARQEVTKAGGGRVGASVFPSKRNFPGPKVWPLWLSELDLVDVANKMLDMKSASIRTVQHQLAALLAAVEQGGEIVITRRNRPVARLAPLEAAASPAKRTPAAVRRYWSGRPPPPAVRSTITHAELVGDGRGEV